MEEEEEGEEEEEEGEEEGEEGEEEEEEGEEEEEEGEEEEGKEEEKEEWEEKGEEEKKRKRMDTSLFTVSNFEMFQIHVWNILKLVLTFFVVLLFLPPCNTPFSILSFSFYCLPPLSPSSSSSFFSTSSSFSSPSFFHFFSCPL